MKKDDPQFRVLAVVPQSSAAGRMKLNGINRFLNEGHDWDLELVRSEAGFSAATFEGLTKDSYDGIFSGWLETPEIAAARERTGIPSVHFGGVCDEAASGTHGMSVLFHDDVGAIVRAAVRHLNAIGRIVTFGFVPSRERTFWSDEREAGFTAELAKGGIKADVFPGGELTDWINALTKPAGLLCAFDDRAADAMAACRRAKLRIPEEVSVLGIGNDALVCERTRPHLSSVAVDYEEQGYRAARELHAMMLRGRRPQKKVIATGAATIVIRASTSGEHPSAAIVRRAMKFIADNAATGIDVGDVARHIRASRRLLDLRFREIAGTTVAAKIREKRLAAVKSMLKTTDRRIGEIAVVCGYRDANYLKSQFRKAFGVSMREYRKCIRRSDA